MALRLDGLGMTLTVPLLPAPDIGLVGAVQSNIGDAQFAWDTSAQASMIIKRRLLTSHVETSKDFVTLKPFSLNGQDLGPLEMNIVNFDAPSGLDGIIGDNFFTGHVVCFDFPGKRVLIRQS